MTDFHYDFTYHDRQLSCNSQVDNPGQFGDYWCDSPWRLVNDSISAMANIKGSVDFILWTGSVISFFIMPRGGGGGYSDIFIRTEARVIIFGS